MDPRPSCFESLASSPFVNRTYGPWRPAVPLPRQRRQQPWQHQWRHVIRKEHVSSPALLPERYFFCTLFSVLSRYSHPLLSFFLSLSFARKYLRTYPYPSIYIYTSVLLSSPLFLSLSPSIYLSPVFLFREASS